VFAPRLVVTTDINFGPIMNRCAFRSTVGLLLGVMLASACDSSAAPTSTPQPGSLTEGTWYLHEANDSTLPATIATRFVGAALEETSLDSAQITIDGNGGWKQRYYLRILITGTLDRTEVVLDEGQFSDVGAGYTLSSSARSRAISVTVPLTGRMQTTEQMVFYTGAPTVSGLYRLTRP
jgi:hypothetical protein